MDRRDNRLAWQDGRSDTKRNWTLLICHAPLSGSQGDYRVRSAHGKPVIPRAAYEVTKAQRTITDP